MGVLKWVDWTVSEPRYFQLQTDHTPVHLALLDEVGPHMGSLPRGSDRSCSLRRCAARAPPAVGVTFPRPDAATVLEGPPRCASRCVCWCRQASVLRARTLFSS